MPIIEKSGYKKKPFYLINEHFETIYPSAFRKVPQPEYVRERLEVPDGDFIDVDWIRNHATKCVILSHGLEGNSHRPYITGMARLFADHGWDVLAWNYRSCSGEINRLKRLYHHGVTDDLGFVVDQVTQKNYETVAMIGVSMGGSTTLKYLGELGEAVNEKVVGGAVFSVPCNLHDSAEQLMLKKNKIYKKRFLKKLISKVKLKAAQFPEINIQNIDAIETFEEFDERFTAPLHGFKNARDFYVTSTSDQFYDRIKRPVLLVNALNDPMLGEKCYPYELASRNQYLFLETPQKGGHVGFMVPGDVHTYSERRALQFIEAIIEK